MSKERGCGVLEIVQFVRERHLVNLEVIRRGLAQRLRERREELWADNVKGEKPDRPPVITRVSRFAKLELLRTSSEYGPKRTAGGELSRTEGESKLRTAREKSRRPVMKMAQKLEADEKRGETAEQEPSLDISHGY